MIELKVSKATLRKAFDIADKMGVGVCITVFFGKQEFSVLCFLLAIFLIGFSLIGTEILERGDDNESNR